MKSLRHRLPSPNSLLVFEAAGRTLNFTRAAEELHVSQAAISKQVKYLEDYLECELFERSGRRVVLTSMGKQLHQKVSASFNYLAGAVEELTDTDDQPVLTLAANTAVSHYWLGAAISAYQQRHPQQELNIRVVTSDTTEDLFAEEINIAIAYEPGLRSDWQMELLFAEELYPVTSPDYLQRHPFEGTRPEALLTHKLLDFEQIEPNWINWKVWLDALDIDPTGLDVSSLFNNYIMLIDAAKRGQGIALGSRYLMDDKLARGDLVRVGKTSMKSGRNYWIALNNSRPLSRKVLAVYDFLRKFTPV